MTNYATMPAGLEKQPYHLTDKGRATRRAWYEKNKHRYFERNRQRRADYAKNNPRAVLARHLVGQAVKLGHMPKPPNEVTRSWNNRWEFHHPDYQRPYYGAWLRIPDHKRVHRGEMECPECTDYEPQIAASLLKSWGIDARAALMAMEAR